MSGSSERVCGTSDGSFGLLNPPGEHERRRPHLPIRERPAEQVRVLCGSRAEHACHSGQVRLCWNLDVPHDKEKHKEVIHNAGQDRRDRESQQLCGVRYVRLANQIAAASAKESAVYNT